jgi:hypothetical protein
LGTRCDDFLSTLELPSTSTLLISPTNAALEWIIVQHWQRIDSVPSQRIGFIVTFYRFKPAVNLNSTSKFALFEFLTSATVKGKFTMACCVHAVPLPCRAALIHICHAAPLPFSDSAVSFVKVRVVAGSIRTVTTAV